MRGRVTAVVVGVVASLALAACGGSSPSTVAALAVYEPAKRLAAPAVGGDLLGTGGRFALAEHRGAVVVVNFWASYCGPCRAEIDDLEALYRVTRPQGVTFVGVATRDERDKAATFVAGRTSYPNIFDPTGKVALAFVDVPPNTIPSTLLIDKRGRVAVAIRRVITQAELEPLIQRLAAEDG